MYENILVQSKLFQGFTEDEVHSVLSCLKASAKKYEKGSYILHAGETTDSMGIILEGAVQVINEDYWGERQILGIFTEGQLFGESYACMGDVPLMVSAVAAEDCCVMMLKAHGMLTACTSSCGFHHRMIENLVMILAGKNLALTRKIDHISRKTIRGKVLAYLSYEAGRQKGSSVEVPFNRQQLAEYLAVDRSALSAELSRMQKEGIITFKKNYFVLHRETEE